MYDVQVSPPNPFYHSKWRLTWDSTRFPIKAIPMLKAMAAGVEPIPIPNTIPPPPLPRKNGASNGSGNGVGSGNGDEAGSKKRKSDVIVID
jgi:hypothetical protein